MPARARTLGIAPGTLPTGPLNAITDVPGVQVGHTTITNTTDLHTGVTAIVPPGFNTSPHNAPSESAEAAGESADAHTEGVGERGPATAAGGSAGRARPALSAAVAVGNGYGKLVGSTQVGELGVLETPILLTGTLSVFRVADALVTWLLDRDPSATSLNPVVGETNDGFLSDIRRRPITPEHVFAALDTASSALPAEGCVGAGTGTAALGFKAGIGTSSRLVTTSAHPRPNDTSDRSTANDTPDRSTANDTPPHSTANDTPDRSTANDTPGQSPADVGAATPGGGTVGVLVQSNFSGTLTVLGTPVPASRAVGTPGGNSCVIVVATDLALDARQLGRIARRAVFAMGRVGSDYAPGSGDYAIAFSTASGVSLPESTLGPLFQATIEATEEALLNSLTMAVDTTGHNGNTRYAVPLDVLASLSSP